MNSVAFPGRYFFILMLLGVLSRHTASGEWQRDDASLAWKEGTNVLWRFSYDSARGKTFFDPLTAAGTRFTSFKPEDHPWHYGLWFSWKYINGANYWEEDRKTGKAEGATRWKQPEITTQSDGSAVIKLQVSYTHPTGRVDLIEERELKVSAPDSSGGYTIDWRAEFTAGPAGAVLDRTPMPGEPKGQVNGGYAGLGLRAAGEPLSFSVITTEGPVDRFENLRARPNAPALACNFRDGIRDVGGVAIFSDPINAGERAPWYVVKSREMRFVCAAILAPKIRTLEPGEKMELRYRIAVRPRAWAVEDLKRGL